jgi:hypothetical protein
MLNSIIRCPSPFEGLQLKKSCCEVNHTQAEEHIHFSIKCSPFKSSSFDKQLVIGSMARGKKPQSAHKPIKHKTHNNKTNLRKTKKVNLNN